MNKIKVLSNRVNFQDTAKFIDELSTTESKKPLFIEMAKMLKGYKYPERIIYNFLKKNSIYLEDNGTQTIVNPERIFRENLANCVDCTCFISTVLKALQIPHLYRMISTQKTGQPEHIYIKTPKFIIDVIKGRSNLKPYDMTNNFNKEYTYTKKYDYYPKY